MDSENGSSGSMLTHDPENPNDPGVTGVGNGSVEVPSFSAPAAARHLFEKTSQALAQSQAEVLKLQTELKQVRHEKVEDQRLHTIVIDDMKTSISSLQSRLAASESATFSEQQLVSTKEEEMQRWKDHCTKIQSELEASQAELAAARSNSLADAEGREAMLREALQTTRQMADMKVEQGARKAAEDVANAMELKRVAEDNSREALMEVAQARSDLDQFVQRMERERRGHELGKEAHQAEMTEVKAEVQALQEKLKRNQVEVESQLSAAQERVEEQSKAVLSAEMERARVAHHNQLLEQQVAEMKDQLASVKVALAEKSARTLRAKMEMELDRLGIQPSPPPPPPLPCGEEAEEGAAVPQLALQSSAAFQMEVQSISDQELSAVVRAQSRVEEGKLRLQLQKSEAARELAERRAALAEKRNQADTLALEGQHLLLTTAQSQTKETEHEIQVSGQRAQDALLAAQHRLELQSQAAAQQVASLEVEMALQGQKHQEALDLLKGQVNSAQLSRDKALRDLGAKQEEAAELKLCLLHAQEENQKLCMLHDAEQHALRAKNRLVSEEMRAQRVAADLQSSALAAAAPLTALRDQAAAEADLAMARIRRLTEERDQAEKDVLKFDLKLKKVEEELLFERGRLGAEVEHKAALLEEEKQSGLEMQEKLRQAQVELESTRLECQARERECKEEERRAKEDFDKEFARRMMAESKVEALYATMGANRTAAHTEVAALTVKNQELQLFLQSKLKEVETREGMLHSLAAKQSAEVDVTLNKLRDQLSAKEDAYRHCVSERGQLQSEVDRLRREHAQHTSQLSASFNQDRLRLMNEKQTLAAELAVAEQNAMEKATALESASQEHTRGATESKSYIESLECQLKKTQTNLDFTHQELVRSQEEVAYVKVEHEQLVTATRSEMHQAKEALEAERQAGARLQDQLGDTAANLAKLTEENLQYGATHVASQLKALKCPICKDWMQNSHTLMSCDHSFCRGCICTALLDEGKCPVCTKRGSRQDVVRNVPLDNLITQVRALIRL